MTYTLYHNPRCSKSRQTLQLLETAGVKHRVVEYLKTPPSAEEISLISKKLGLTAHEFMRKGEPEYTQLELSSSEHSEEELFQIMHQHPKLIERPILVGPHAAKIGRPPEAVLALVSPVKK